MAEEEKEKRIRKITHLYYSRQDVQKAIFDFSKNREICPRYFEGFGKRPDSFQYPNDVFEMARKGATSFNCSEELWENPMEIVTGMSEKQANQLRIGWDLLIDIDSKYIDYSKICAERIINLLKFHGIKNVGIKFSITGETPILIKNSGKISLLPIKEVINLLKNKTKIQVLSLDKNQKLKFSNIYDYLEHEDIVYELKHSQSTIPLKVTSHHSVFVWNNSFVIEKKVSELKKGDFLITYNSNENLFSSKLSSIKNEFVFGKNQNSKEKITRKVKITPNLMRLIGYFLAEGHVTNIINQVGFTFNKNEKEYIEDVKKLLNSITNKKISIRHPNPGSTQILIHSKEWANFFDIFCGKKNKKHLPSFAFRLNKKLFLELLKGYIRGDGYKIGKYGIVVKSVSRQLITELIWLCKLNGISCNLSSEKNKPRLMPQGNYFKGSLVYMLRIPKSELSLLEFNRKRNKFSPFPGDKTFPVDGLCKVYSQIKPKMFNSHRVEQMTLKKKRANLNRIRKVLDWFYNFNEKDIDDNSKKILENYEKLFSSDISVIELLDLKRKGKEMVYDVSVEETESFFGNYYPILLHNSGSKGFHIIVPWKAFPKEVNGIQTKDMFPEWPRIIVKYIIEQIKEPLIEKISEIERPSKYVKNFQASKEVMPDIILVSPRHLFRMPYSLHEKTALASVVLNPENISKFDLRDADPLKAEIKNFIPDVKEGEASEFLVQALDWYKENHGRIESSGPGGVSFGGKSKYIEEFKPVNVGEISDKNFPNSIKKILEGLSDGKKRALFVLISFFRSIGMEKQELEKRIYEWNSKNNPQLKEGNIKSQLIQGYKNKIVLPPNFDKDYYAGIGIIPTPEELRYKNPVSYFIKKTLREQNKFSEE